MSLVVELDYVTNDSLKPIGSQVGAITREIWLCDIWLAGIHYERISDCEIRVSERDLTKLIMFYSNPDIIITVID